MDVALSLRGIEAPEGEMETEQFNEQIVLKAGEFWSRNIDKTIGDSPVQDTLWKLEISGDLNQLISKTIHFGEKVTAALNASAVYLTQELSIPVSFENRGNLDSNFDAVFILDGQELMRGQFYVPKGQTVEQIIPLSPGQGVHILQCLNPFGEVQASFAIAIPQASLSVVPNFSLVSLIPGQAATISFSAANSGGLGGFVELPLSIPGVVELSQRVYVPAGEIKNRFFWLLSGCPLHVVVGHR